jgi:hypothetical protein
MNTEDSEVWNLLQWDGYSATLTSDSAIYWVWPAAFIGILSGLYFYWRPARTAFLVFLIVSIGMAVFEGVRVSHPIDIVVGSLMHPIYGALVAISYFTSVASKFESRKPAATLEGK